MNAATRDALDGIRFLAVCADQGGRITARELHGLAAELESALHRGVPRARVSRIRRWWRGLWRRRIA